MRKGTGEDNKINYHMSMTVIESWEVIKQIPNYETTMSQLIFDRMFEIDPIEEFTFQRLSPKAFVQHQRRVVDMIDLVIELLGPDIDALGKDLMELGQRHVKYDVRSDSLPIMLEGIEYSIETMLGKEYFTDDHKESWNYVLTWMMNKMRIGMR